MRTHDGTPGFSLDSFLDMLTNLVGFLILVAVLVAIGARSMQVSLGTPILSDPPVGAHRMLFECRANRVLFINEEQLDTRMNAVISQYTADGESPDLEAVQQHFEENDVGDTFYRVRLELEQRLRTENDRMLLVTEAVVVYEPRNPVQGETIKELRDHESAYGKVLGSLDAKQHYLVFLVRPDSFEAFRSARELARAAGLATGWRPMPADRPLKFSSGGTSIGIMR